MSIRSEITRINNNIAAAYSAAESKGATMPATENSANLADTIGSIPLGGVPVDEDSLTPIEFGCDANGFYFSSAAGEGSTFSFGRDSTGIYAKQEVTNG